jgi:hypothetical protein
LNILILNTRKSVRVVVGYGGERLRERAEQTVKDDDGGGGRRWKMKMVVVVGGGR